MKTFKPVRLIGFAFGLALACVALQVVAGQASGSARPAEWAQPIEQAGLPNLHKVSDVLYRGAQPSAQGMRNLAQLGVKTVVNLRWLHSDSDELAGTALSSVHIPIRTWKLKEKHVLEFLRVVTDPARQPVFVHCQHGADRTGTMAAFYRLVVQGWSKERAIEEMTKGGYNYHSVWKNLPDFIRAADIPAYRRKLGLAAPASSEDRQKQGQPRPESR